MKPIYLDYNATTPVDPKVAESMMPYLTEHFGNPSSGHAYGQATKAAVDLARCQVADMLGCEPREIVFTSGGSESNNFAIKGVALAQKSVGNHIITTNIEHPAVNKVCDYLEEYENCQISYLEVDKEGLLDAGQVADAITDKTILITIMHVNNEIGTIEPIREISEIARRKKITFHTDAAQSIGKIPVNVNDLGVDLLSVAGHKLYAPKGIGALYIKPGTGLSKQVHGAGQESGFRAGTENVLEIVGLGHAAELISNEDKDHGNKLAALRDRLESKLISQFSDLVCINGHRTKRLPNTLSISFKNIRANEILDRLTDVAISAGAACHSGGVDLSHVLEAIGLPLEYAMGTLRISVGRFTSTDDIDRAFESVKKVIRGLI